MNQNPTPAPQGASYDASGPAVVNALAGKGVHLITVNDYLASRDAEWMGRFTISSSRASACGLLPGVTGTWWNGML